MNIKRFIHENRWFDSMILVVFILAFTGATYNHVMDLVSGGLFPYTKKWIINWRDGPLQVAGTTYSAFKNSSCGTSWPVHSRKVRRAW